MSEFTGERVIPGQVDEDLWGEHMARYAFAARFANAGRVLDLGCGTGYGTAELGKRATEAVGVDVAADAIEYASANYRSAKFIQSPATDTPFSEETFDLVTSFELIEHLNDWHPLLAEAKRVIHPTGLFLVSTPNKLYYAEARGESGPNPFHQHEFEYAEFRDALLEYFPYVQVLLQDRLESFAIYEFGKSGDTDARVVRTTEDPTTANFFIGVCSMEPLPDLKPYLYVPRAANLLREREKHVDKLKAELEQVRQWLQETKDSRDGLMAQVKLQEQESDKKTAWGAELQRLLAEAQTRIVELQDDVPKQQAEAAKIIEGLNTENLKHIQWAKDTEQSLKETAVLLDKAEATLIERTELMQKLNAKLDVLRLRLEGVRQSRWYKLGRHLGLGPRVD